MEPPRHLLLYSTYRVYFSEPVFLRCQRGRNPKPVLEYDLVFFLDKRGALCYKNPNASCGYWIMFGEEVNPAALRVCDEQYSARDFWSMVTKIE